MTDGSLEWSKSLSFFLILNTESLNFKKYALDSYLKISILIKDLHKLYTISYKLMNLISEFFLRKLTESETMVEDVDKLYSPC